VGGPYALALTQRKAIDAARTNTAYGRWANDPRGSDMSANAEFVINRATGTGRLRATRAIAKGSEVLVSYGPAYWRAFGPHAKLLARPAAAPRMQREVIDLTTMGASTFSSDLADAFDKACRDDPAYAADLASHRSDAPQDDPEVRPVADEFVVRDGRLFHRTSGCLLVPAASSALRACSCRLRRRTVRATRGRWTSSQACRRARAPATTLSWCLCAS